MLPVQNRLLFERGEQCTTVYKGACRGWGWGVFSDVTLVDFGKRAKQISRRKKGEKMG